MLLQQTVDLLLNHMTMDRLFPMYYIVQFYLLEWSIDLRCQYQDVYSTEIV
jgi:hypothetical protein